MRSFGKDSGIGRYLEEAQLKRAVRYEGNCTRRLFGTKGYRSLDDGYGLGQWIIIGRRNLTTTENFPPRISLIEQLSITSGLRDCTSGIFNKHIGTEDANPVKPGTDSISDV